jgi:hypothetical protein
MMTAEGDVEAVHMIQGSVVQGSISSLVHQIYFGKGKLH